MGRKSEQNIAKILPKYSHTVPQTKLTEMFPRENPTCNLSVCQLEVTLKNKHGNLKMTVHVIELLFGEYKNAE